MRSLALTTLFCAGTLGAVPQSALSGEWIIRPAEAGAPGRLHLTLSTAWTNASTLEAARLEGLSPAQVSSSGGPVSFRLRREAGWFAFEGWFRGGRGAGHFDFTPDPGFAAALARRGLERPTAAQQLSLARHDLGLEFLDALTTHGYVKPATRQLVEAGEHGVGLAYLRDMAALGHRLGSLEALVTLRDHGVTPAYVGAVGSLGYRGLSADELTRLVDHGVRPAFIQELQRLGYQGLSSDQLIRMRDHGISASFVQNANSRAGKRLPVETLMDLRARGGG
jgi:hypothetical protein